MENCTFALVNGAKSVSCVPVRLTIILTSNGNVSTGRASESLTAAAATHCRLTRLVRLFNDEYGAPILITTLNLLLSQIYVMNDIVSVIVDNDNFESKYTNFVYVYDTFMWTCYWLRFWWICYRVDDLIKQVRVNTITWYLNIKNKNNLYIRMIWVDVFSTVRYK